MQLRLLWTLPVALLAGGLMQLAFSPFDWWWLALLLSAVVLGLAYWRAPFWHGWMFGIGWFGIGAWWLVQTFYLYGGLPYIVGSLIVVLMGLVMGVFPALWMLIAVRLSSSPRMLLIAFPAAVVLLEWLRGHLFTGLPWTAFGNLLLDTPAASWLSIVGVYGAAAIPALIVAALAVLWQQPRSASVALILVASCTIFAPTIVNGDHRPMKAALVQGNVSQDHKWDVAFLRQTLETYIRLSAAQATKADVIIWPESAIPFFPSQAVAWDRWLQQQMQQWQRPVLYGGDRMVEANHAQSGMYAFNEGQREFVGKHHLVPFGEYVPAWLPFIHTLIPAIADFQPAQDHGVLSAAGILFGSLICYESIFPEEARQRVLHGANTLIVASNDAWYGHSPAVWQHTQAARARAVETGRYVLRVGNTGITTVIAADGQMQSQLPWWQADSLLAEFIPLHHQTVYVRWGDLPALVFSLLMLITLAVLRFCRGRPCACPE